MSCLGPLGGGGPHASPGSMGQADSSGVILHWQLHAHHELARAVDRSFMQLPTRSYCVPLLAGSARRPCAHANSCTRHARRGGALGGLGFSDGSLGGLAPLRGLSWPSFAQPIFPVDPAAGAGHLQLWSADLACCFDFRGQAGATHCASARQGWLEVTAGGNGALR